MKHILAALDLTSHAAVHGISKVVQDQDADLLVMGTRGRTGNPPRDVLVAH